MQTLNLSTHCLEQLVEVRNQLPSFAMRELFTGLIESLRAAPKFLLPDGGRVIDDQESVARLYDQIRLPFPCVALEYEAHGAINTAIETQSSRRIALCWDLRHGAPAYVQAVTGCGPEPQKCLVVQSLSYLNEHSFWIPIMGLLVIDLDDAVVKGTVAQHAQQSPQFMALIKHRLVPQRTNMLVHSFQMHVYPYPMSDFSGSGQTDEEIISNISADTSDELLAMIGFAALTSCANVEFDVLRAEEKLNKKRAAKKREPFYDVRVLMLAGHGYQVSTQPGGVCTGAGGHASPRSHLRRGHVRRLSDKNVWVNAAVINAGAKGVHALQVPAYKLV